MSQFMDFGFNSEEYNESSETFAFCQFVNPYYSDYYGIGIKCSQAELAKFTPDNTWNQIEQRFSGGKTESMYCTANPRLIILNRGYLLMEKEGNVIPYNALKDNGGWKKFSYLVVWFLDENNQALSEIPFRLKSGGQAGISFIKNYQDRSNPNSFTSKFLSVYQQLSGDKSSKNQEFFSHAVYCPTIDKQEVVSTKNGKSSWVGMTTGFVEPTQENFLELLINPKQQPELSNRIKEAIESTKDWLKTGSTKNEEVQIEESDSTQPGVAREYVEQYSSNSNGNKQKPILKHETADVDDEPEYTAEQTDVGEPEFTAPQMDAIPF